MALPVVVINSSGSNTAASGAGPSTALFGTGAATASNTSVDLSADSPNLSGVSITGDAVLWVGSSSGRQFSKITNVNNTSKVVTVASAYANTESGKNWGIGGKRASMAGSAQLFKGDWDNGWIVDVQTGETISSTIIFTGSALSSISPPLVTSTTYSGTWGSQPLIQTSTNSLIMFNVSNNLGFRFENLSFKTTAGTPGVCFQASSSTGSNITWRNCIFDGFAMALDGSNGAGFPYQYICVDKCEVKNCTSTGSNQGAISCFNGHLALTNSYLHGNANTVECQTDGMIESNVFANNRAGSGQSGSIALSSQGQLFKNNSIYNCDVNNSNALAAVYFGFGATTGTGIIHENNIYWGCVGYAVFSGNSPGMITQNNAYGGNNGGGVGSSLNALPLDATDISLSANPYVSTVTPDWGLNNTVGAGKLCRGAAAAVPNASANTPGDLGAIPSGGGAAAGGGCPHLAGRGGGLAG